MRGLVRFDSLQRQQFLDTTVIASFNAGKDITLPLFAYYGVSRALLDVPLKRKGIQVEAVLHCEAAVPIPELRQFI